MNALVPVARYGALAVSRKRAFRYAQTGLRAYKRARTYGPTIVRGVRRFQKMYRKYKRKSKMQRRSAPSAKRTAQKREVVAVNEPINITNLTIRPIRVTDMGTGMGQRERMNLYLKGIKICETLYHIRNNSVGQGMEVHWALCQLKSPLEPASFLDRSALAAAIKAYIAPAFFRDSRNTETLIGELGRSRPFVDAQIAYPYDYLCQPLNTDRFHVITHKRFQIESRTDDTVSNGRWMKKIMKYWKVNKFMSFINEDDEYGKLPFFVCIWYTTRTSQDYPTTPSTESPYVSHNFKDTVAF